MGLIFVTGGAKSGKSKFAEEMLLKLNNGKQKNIYLATSLVFDEEMKEKVRLHKKRRKDEWFTVEAYKNFEKKLYIQTLEKLNKDVEHSVIELLNVADQFENTIIVSNELGMGLVPSYPLGRYFREIAGKMNQIVAETADEVYLVVSGIPMKIK